MSGESGLPCGGVGCVCVCVCGGGGGGWGKRVLKLLGLEDLGALNLREFERLCGLCEAGI